MISPLSSTVTCSRVLQYVFTVWLISEKLSMDLLHIKKVLTTGGEPTKAEFPIQDQAWWATTLQIESHYRFEFEWYHIALALSLATFQRSGVPSICWWHTVLYFLMVCSFLPWWTPLIQSLVSKTDERLFFPPCGWFSTAFKTNITLIINNVINCYKSNRVDQKQLQKAMWFKKWGTEKFPCW